MQGRILFSRPDTTSRKSYFGFVEVLLPGLSRRFQQAFGIGWPILRRLAFPELNTRINSLPAPADSI